MSLEYPPAVAEVENALAALLKWQGISISITKTEVIFQPAPHINYSDPTITVKGQKLQTVDKFTYLGSTLSRNVPIDDEVDARIAKASTAFGRLRKNVWERQGLNLQTKMTVYEAVVMNTLLYACETRFLCLSIISTDLNCKSTESSLLKMNNVKF